jgi:transposase
MDDLGVIALMSGIAHHDGWKPYRAYDVVHSLCNAHHVRELNEIGWISHQFWANDMATLLCEANAIVKAAKATGAPSLSVSALHSIRTRYGQIIAAGRLTNPGPSTATRRRPTTFSSASTPSGRTSCASPPTSTPVSITTRRSATSGW